MAESEQETGEREVEMVDKANGAPRAGLAMPAPPAEDDSSAVAMVLSGPRRPAKQMRRNEPTPYIDTFEEGSAYWVVLATGEQTGGAYSLTWELCPRGSGPGAHDQDEQFFVMDDEITYRAAGRKL